MNEHWVNVSCLLSTLSYTELEHSSTTILQQQIMIERGIHEWIVPNLLVTGPNRDHNKSEASGQ